MPCLFVSPKLIWRAIEQVTYPDSHSDATLDGNAGPGNAVPCSGRNLQLLRGGGCVHANVNLGVDNINTLAGRSLEGSLERLLVRGGARGSRSRLAREMGLVADTVDPETVRLDELDNALGTGSLVAVVLKVVVVVCEFVSLLIWILTSWTYRTAWIPLRTWRQGGKQWECKPRQWCQGRRSSCRFRPRSKLQAISFRCSYWS
jgi:hypothetical protein